MEIKNRNALITGGNRGIGLALAKEFAKRQAHLHIAVRKPAEFANQEELLQLGAKSVHTYLLDVGQPSSIETFAKDFLSKSTPDIVVNNSGQLTGGLLETQSPEAIREMLNVNLIGLILLTRALLPTMLKNKRGVIVNNASVSGRMTLPCASTYAASKAGVVAFTQALQLELKDSGVNTLLMITPGVQTRMYEEIPKLYGKNFDLDFLSGIPDYVWAERVCNALEAGKHVVNPTGMNKVGLVLNQHLPSVFNWYVGKKFHR